VSPTPFQLIMTANPSSRPPQPPLPFPAHNNRQPSSAPPQSPLPLPVRYKISSVSTTPVMHDVTSVNDTGDAFLTGIVDTSDIMHHWCCWYQAVKITNFAGVNDTGDACIASVVDTGDAPVGPLAVRQCL
jgi:hypothetical protein